MNITSSAKLRVHKRITSRLSFRPKGEIFHKVGCAVSGGVDFSLSLEMTNFRCGKLYFYGP